MPPWRQAVLGASFEAEGNGLRVKKVDAGSPAWEAGLVEGDNVVFFAFAGKPLKGGPAAWKERLEDPVPGKEHYFRVRRDGKNVDMLTTARQRPLWRTPTRVLLAIFRSARSKRRQLQSQCPAPA